MSTREDIIKKLRTVKEELTSRYPIASLALFGSFARNDQTENSDIDILVEFNAAVGTQFFDMANELEQRLGRKVDLVSKKGIKSKYLTAIQSDLIYV